MPAVDVWRAGGRWRHCWRCASATESRALADQACGESSCGGGEAVVRAGRENEEA